MIGTMRKYTKIAIPVLILCLIIFAFAAYVIRERAKAEAELERIRIYEQAHGHPPKSPTIKKQVLMKMSGQKSTGGISKPFTVTKDTFKVKWESDSATFKAELLTYPGKELVGTFNKPEGFGHDIQGGSQDFRDAGQYYLKVTSDARFLITAEQSP